MNEMRYSTKLTKFRHLRHILNPVISANDSIAPFKPLMNDVIRKWRLFMLHGRWIAR